MELVRDEIRSDHNGTLQVMLLNIHAAQVPICAYVKPAATAAGGEEEREKKTFIKTNVPTSRHTPAIFRPVAMHPSPVSNNEDRAS